MMKHLLKHIQVLPENSPYHGKKVDILLNGGRIEQISEKPLNLAAQDGVTHDLDGCYVANGFCDLYVNTGDPGFEYREDIHSVADAAVAGGYTLLCATADNQPVTQTKSQVEYILNKAASTPVHILPLGAVTENFDGKTPTEMYDMHHAGAVAFSDMPHAVKDSGVLLRALQYVQPFCGLIITMPFDKTLVGEGQVNEGEISVRMGMKGITNVSEYTVVQRDLELLRYAGGRLHMMGISTKESVDLIRKAKQEKLPVTCSVFVHHLISDEATVKDFDSNYKVFPPLRTQSDQQALIEGLKDGTIDCISTQHTPLNIDSKNVEFEYADYGMTGLETSFGLLAKKLDGLISKEQLQQLLSDNARKIIRRETIIDKGATADLVILDFSEQWQLEEKNIRSKSKNTPYIGVPLKGKVKAVFSKGRFLSNP